MPRLAPFQRHCPAVLVGDNQHRRFSLLDKPAVAPETEIWCGDLLDHAACCRVDGDAAGEVGQLAEHREHGAGVEHAEGFLIFFIEA